MCTLHVKSLINSQFSTLCLSYLCSINTCISDCLFVSQMFYQRKNLRNGNCMNIISIVFISSSVSYLPHFRQNQAAHHHFHLHSLHICSQHIIYPYPLPIVFRRAEGDHSINHRITAGRLDSNYYIARPVSFVSVRSDTTIPSLVLC